jgi:hypothetical protein
LWLTNFSPFYITRLSRARSNYWRNLSKISGKIKWTFILYPSNYTSRDLPPKQKDIYGEVIIKIPFLVSKSWRQPNVLQKGTSHWQIKEPIQSPVVVCLPVCLVGWLVFVFWVIFVCLVGFFFFMKCGIHLCYHIEIFIIHTHPLFSSSPFKRQGREDYIYLQLLGKGKLRKRMYVCIANPHHEFPAYKVTHLLNLSVMLESQSLRSFHSYYLQTRIYSEWWKIGVSWHLLSQLRSNKAVWSAVLCCFSCCKQMYFLWCMPHLKNICAFPLVMSLFKWFLRIVLKCYLVLLSLRKAVMSFRVGMNIVDTFHSGMSFNAVWL